MTKTKHIKKALLSSALALVVCFTMLVGTTFAWFTDSVTSGSNIIQTGKLDIVLEYWDGTQWVDAEGKILEFQKAGGNTGEEVLWEPGCTYQLPKIRVRNEGNLAAYVLLRVNGITGDEELLKVIKFTTKVSNTPESLLTGSAANTYKKLEANPVEFIYGTNDGTVMMDWSLAGKGEVTPNTGHTDTTAEFTVSGHMDENAGNEYQNKKIVGVSITVLATQEVYEYDSFGREYDKNATLPVVGTYVSNMDELTAALKNGKTNLVLTNDIEISETIDIAENTFISGGKTIRRGDGFTGTVINVKGGATLTIEDTVIDGGAVWTGDIDPTLLRGTTNTGVTATGNLIATEYNGNVVLNQGTILQNNNGASAVSLATRGGGTLTLNGAQIINNTAAGGGAIWGGGNIEINEGSKINGNHATSLGGAIRLVNGNNAISLTMNGGEMNNNTSDGNGGAIWGGNNATYNFNGGEMAYNSAVAGGAIWTGTYEIYTFAGDFSLHDNSATNLGGAVRFCDHSSLTMTGGKVYNNTVNGVDNAFYLNNNSATITGGSISDNFAYGGGLGLTIGAADIDGVISYNLSTNHNTAYLASEFNAFEFTVNENDEHFANFNFKPATGYTYTAGDEAKLVCLNEGYETYWDATTGTFRLKAKNN